MHESAYPSGKPRTSVRTKMRIETAEEPSFSGASSLISGADPAVSGKLAAGLTAASKLANIVEPGRKPRATGGVSAKRQAIRHG